MLGSIVNYFHHALDASEDSTQSILSLCKDMLAVLV